MKQARIRDIEARVIELADEQWTSINFSIRLHGQKYADIFKQKIECIPEIADEETLIYIEKYVTLESLRAYGRNARKAALSYAEERTAEIKKRGLAGEVINASQYMVNAMKRRIEESEKNGSHDDDRTRGGCYHACRSETLRRHIQWRKIYICEQKKTCLSQKKIHEKSNESK